MKKLINLVLILALIISPNVVSANTFLKMPTPGSMITSTSNFTPPLINGIAIHPEDPFAFDFIVNKGDNEAMTTEELTVETTKMVKYFLASLTVPESEMWVNLSPYEKNRIIPESFGKTEMGRDLLAQDYILKQLTSSLMYPKGDLGRNFWDRIYAKAQKELGTTNIPVNTFNKIWITPEKAVVYEDSETNSVYIVESKLKVMLEKDLLAMKKSGEITTNIAPSTNPAGADEDKIDTSEIIRQVLIPEIEREVNQGQHFADLRQIFHSMILASWYKDSLKESLLGQVYVDQNKTKGIETEDKQVKQKIYNKYVEAFKTGVYDYIEEEFDAGTKEILPRRYFSGGFGVNGRFISKGDFNNAMLGRGLLEKAFTFVANLTDIYAYTKNKAMTSDNAILTKEQRTVQEIFTIIRSQYNHKGIRTSIISKLSGVKNVYQFDRNNKELVRKLFANHMGKIVYDLNTPVNSKDLKVVNYYYPTGFTPGEYMIYYIEMKEGNNICILDKYIDDTMYINYLVDGINNSEQILSKIKLPYGLKILEYKKGERFVDELFQYLSRIDSKQVYDHTGKSIGFINKRNFGGTNSPIDGTKNHQFEKVFIVVLNTGSSTGIYGIEDLDKNAQRLLGTVVVKDTVNDFALVSKKISDSTDSAMKTLQEKTTTDTLTRGGIIMDSSILNKKLIRNDKGIPVPISEQPLFIQNLEGLRPVFVDIIEPGMPSVVTQLLGRLNEQEDTTDKDSQLGFNFIFPMDLKWA